jgi:hypothetical protein
LIDFLRRRNARSPESVTLASYEKTRLNQETAMKALLSAPLVILLGSTPSSANCYFEKVTFLFGDAHPQRAEADSGKDCTEVFSSGRNAGVSSIAIVRRPKHGSASWNGSVGYPSLTYRSAPGYRGPDDFVYAVTGGGGTGIPGGYLKQGASNITVTMTVK